MKKVMNFVREKGKYISLIAAGLVIGGAASVAFAAIPDSTGTIHGCYGTGLLNAGNLRAIDSAATCKSNETALNWNQNGGTSNAQTPSYAYVNIAYDRTDPNQLTYIPTIDTNRSTNDVTLVGTHSNSPSDPPQFYCLKTTFTPKSASVTGQGGYPVGLGFKDANGWTGTDQGESVGSVYCGEFPDANVVVLSSSSFFINFIK